MMSVLTYGTIALTSARGRRSSDSIPHERDDAIRRLSSSIRSGVRATSMPPLWVKTPISLYCSTLSAVSAVISREWSVRKMKFEAWPVEPPGFGQRALLDLDDVRPAEPGEVVDEAVADDAGADDDDARGTRLRAQTILLEPTPDGLARGGVTAGDDGVGGHSTGADGRHGRLGDRSGRHRDGYDGRRPSDGRRHEESPQP